jgi:integrase
LRPGVDPVTVSAILGHSNPTVTLSVYGHLIDGSQRAAMTALGDHLAKPRKNVEKVVN